MPPQNDSKMFEYSYRLPDRTITFSVAASEFGAQCRLTAATSTSCCEEAGHLTPFQVSELASGIDLVTKNSHRNCRVGAVEVSRQAEQLMVQVGMFEIAVEPLVLADFRQFLEQLSLHNKASMPRFGL